MARWRSMQAGEPIGVVAPSGPVDGRALEQGLEALRSWGHPLVLAPNLVSRSGYLAGDDDERVAGIEWVLEQGARVLIATRGGYGVTRLLDALPWQRLVDDEVCLVGFSDLTGLINPLGGRAGAAQVHGPMVAAGLHRPANANRLRRVLDGRLEGGTLFRFKPGAVVRPGRVRGLAVGGNLSLLVSLLGTPYEPAFDDGILFIEEVGEALYRIDRMLTHLAASGRLCRVKALIGGSLRACRPSPGRNGKWRELLAEVAPPHAVVLTGLPFGHGAANMAFPIGVPVEVDTLSGELAWSS